MAAILGMESPEVDRICAEAARGQVCEAANINSPEQIVISGDTAAVERATRLAESRGAKKAKMLPVSAPFHSSLMKPAQDRLAEDLKDLPFSDPKIPVVCNVDAQVVNSGDLSRDALIRQVSGSVKWDQSVRLLIASGVKTLIEVGPGKVLWGLMRQIDRTPTSLYVSDESSLQKTLEQLSRARA
jgi:[acyl-carrier-protein] S-malonyltransferase